MKSQGFSYIIGLPNWFWFKNNKLSIENNIIVSQSIKLDPNVEEMKLLAKLHLNQSG